ncbi:MAG: ribonuclease, partial [Francisellaceae bacterium]|nr:ribonuclease [Francisellaceae bacterium]
MDKDINDPFAQREAEKYHNPIPSREFILEFLNKHAAPITFKELADILNLTDEEMVEALRRRLKAMIRDDQLERLKGGYFYPTTQRVLVEGKVLIEKNKTWVIPNDDTPKIFLQEENAKLFTGNKVVVSTIDNPDFAFREGKLVSILEQQTIYVTGRFVKENEFLFVIPHGKDITQDILILPEHSKNAQDGHIVL